MCSLRALALQVPLLLTLLCAARPATAQPVPLTPLPRARLMSLAPLLRSQDIALIESDGRGQQRQITVMTLVAAPPATVREVLLHPESYRDFVRNMDKSEVRRDDKGNLLHSYELSYTVLKIDGIHRFSPLPAEPGASVGPVEIFDADPKSNGQRHYRWEFLPAGSGTLVVVYGYTDVRHSGGVVDQLLARIPQLEHGVALSSQCSIVLSMKARAEQLAGAGARAGLPAPGNAGYDFLVERGVVVMLRTQGGRLSDISLIEQVRARPDLLLDVARQAASWSEFVPSITRSSATTSDGMPAIDLTQSLPLLSFRTIYGVRPSESAVDMFGLSGDLRGSRLRWDIRPGAQGQSQLILRSSQAFDRASLVLRQLYRLEPLFEYGVNVALSLVIHRGVKTRAEQRMASLTVGRSG